VGEIFSPPPTRVCKNITGFQWVIYEVAPIDRNAVYSGDGT